MNGNSDHQSEEKFKGFFAGLRSVVSVGQQAQAELDRRAATAFSVCGSQYWNVQETDLSRIFAALLNPAGTHGQGDRFLRLFHAELQGDSESETSRKLSGYFSCRDLHLSKVHCEYPTDDKTRIDIVLQLPDNRWIGIENKPWVGEHQIKGKNEYQTEHYLNYLQRRKKPTAWMLYLSGNGCDPRMENRDQKNCLTVPYRRGSDNSPSVENWVLQCWRECEADRVRWFLKDLLEYIRRAFGSLDPSIAKEDRAMAQNIVQEAVKKFIMEEDKNLELAVYAEGALKQIRDELPNRILDAVKGKLLQTRGDGRIPEGWEIQDGYNQKYPGKDPHLLLYKRTWERDPEEGHQFPGVQLIRSQNTSFLGLKLPNQAVFNDKQKNKILIVISEDPRFDSYFQLHGDVRNLGHSIWWKLAHPLTYWEDPEFMKAARTETKRKEIAANLAKALSCLTRLAHRHLSL